MRIFGWTEIRTLLYWTMCVFNWWDSKLYMESVKIIYKTLGWELMPICFIFKHFANRNGIHSMSSHIAHFDCGMQWSIMLSQNLSIDSENYQISFIVHIANRKCYHNIDVYSSFHFCIDDEGEKKLAQPEKLFFPSVSNQKEREMETTYHLHAALASAVIPVIWYKLITSVEVCVHWRFFFLVSCLLSLAYY